MKALLIFLLFYFFQKIIYGQVYLAPNKQKPSHLIQADSVFIYPKLLSELRYASEDNFLQEKLYPQNPGVWLEKETARALRMADGDLRNYGLRLLIWDAYRPYSVTQYLYENSPNKRYVADPRRGSVHNRGSAVDVTLTNLEGVPLEMPTDFDAFGLKATPVYLGGSEVSRQNRNVLIRVMTHRGFKVNAGEWWHFEFKNAYQHSISDWRPWDGLLTPKIQFDN